MKTILLIIMLFFVPGIYYALKKGLNEIIKALMSLDRTLSKIEKSLEDNN